MQLSSQVEYAMVALTHLARTRDDITSIATLGETLRMPRAFLEKTLLVLKNAGYVESRMGKRGGFRLARPPSEIRLADVVRAFGQPIAATRSVSSFFYRATPLAIDPGLLGFFKAMRDSTARRMEEATFADVIEEPEDSAGVYLDNAATSFPKPEAVLRRMERFARESGGSGGRAGHRKSIAAYGVIVDARAVLARLFGAPDPDSVCLMSNATEALNTAIYGLAEPGGRVITTSMEHNSVWRPLVDLRDRLGCELVVVRADRAGICDAGALRDAITPDTTLVALTCASNVTGAIQPYAEVAARCDELGVPLVLDAAQAAGVLPIDIGGLPGCALAFTGHKGLLGPQGTGGLVVGPALAARLRPLKRGGTGTNSESAAQPAELPEKLESGTLNGHGIAGLGAGVEHVLARGVAAIRAHEMRLWRRLRDGLVALPGVRVHGPDREEQAVAIVSVTVAGLQPTDVGFLLDVHGGVMTRTGLHCAPLAHETIGTLPLGTVRFSLGAGSSEADVDAAIDALASIHQHPRTPAHGARATGGSHGNERDHGR